MLQFYYCIAIGPNTYTLNKANENLLFGRFLYELGQRFLQHYTTEATAPQQKKSYVILDVNFKPELKDWKPQHEIKPTHILLSLHWLQPKINIHRNHCDSIHIRMTLVKQLRVFIRHKVFTEFLSGC